MTWWEAVLGLKLCGLLVIVPLFMVEGDTWYKMNFTYFEYEIFGVDFQTISIG